MKSKRISVLNGPNLNLLGIREPHIYGKTTLKDLENQLNIDAKHLGVELEFFQSNHEGILIDKIQEHFKNSYDGIIINPGGLTHTSVALRDALLAVNVPFIEVHISNIFSREPFRHHSYLSDKALAVISGMGILGYRLALIGLVHHLNELSFKDGILKLP